MMSVVNQFTAKNVRYSNDESRSAYILTTEDSRCVFRFNFLYIRKALIETFWFFDFNTNQCLMVVPAPAHEYADAKGRFKCFITKFWIKDDMPVLSARLFDRQDEIMAEISSQFKDNYATYLLDNVINS